MTEAKEAMTAPAADVFAADELPRFKRCSAEGRYDHGRAVFIGPRPIRRAARRAPARAARLRAALAPQVRLPARRRRPCCGGAPGRVSPPPRRPRAHAHERAQL